MGTGWVRVYDLLDGSIGAFLLHFWRFFFVGLGVRVLLRLFLSFSALWSLAVSNLGQRHCFGSVGAGWSLRIDGLMHCLTF